MVWVVVYRAGSADARALREQLAVDDDALGDALAALEARGQVQRSGEGDAASTAPTTFIVPVDAEHGWEAAVFDHFQTVVRAIGTQGAARRAALQRTTTSIGGATLSFDVHAGASAP